jgi:hypothetical protein
MQATLSREVIRPPVSIPTKVLQLTETNTEVPAFTRTPEETAKLQRVIATLFGLSSGKFGFELLPHPENWACGFSPENQARIEEELTTGSLDLENMTDKQFEPDAFYYSLEEIKTMPEQEIYGVTHHESAHAQYSSFRHILIGQKIAEKEGFLPTTWGLISNGLEDGRINRQKTAESFVIKDQIGALYIPWEKKVAEHMSTQSLTRQYALCTVKYWLNGKPFEKGVDPRVAKLFTETKDQVGRFINENDRQKAFDILKNEIWPKVRTLETEEKKDQSLRDLQSNKKSLWQKLKDKLRKMFGKEPKEPEHKPITGDERKKLEEKFKNLPQDKKEELLKKAGKELDKKQAEEAKKDSVKGFTYEYDKKADKYKLKQTIKPDEEDKKLGRELIEDAIQGENEVQVEKINAEKKLMQMRKDGFEANEEDGFDEFTGIQETVLGIRNNFMRKLERIVPRAIKRDFGGEYNTGPRIDNGKLAKRAPVKDARFYQKRSIEIKGDPLLNVELIMDNSPSMEGEKIKQAKRAAVFMLEVLNEMELPACVKRFSNKFDWIQRRDETYRNPRCRVKPTIISTLDAAGNGTNIGSPLEETKNAVRAFNLRHPNTLCLVIVVTDGDANVGKTGDDLKRLIREVQRKALVININLAGTKEEVEKSKLLFGAANVVDCSNASELPDAMFKVLQSGFEKALNKLH